MRQYDELWTKPVEVANQICRSAKGGSSWHILHQPEVHLLMYPDDLMKKGEQLLGKAKSLVPEGSSWAKRIEYVADGYTYWNLSLQAEKFYVNEFKDKKEKTVVDIIRLKNLLDKRESFVLSLPEKYQERGRRLPVCAEDVLYDAKKLRPGAAVLFNPKEPYSIDFERMMRYYKRFKVPSMKAVGWTNYHTEDGDLVQAGEGCKDTVRRTGKYCQKVIAGSGEPDFGMEGIFKRLRLEKDKKYKLGIWFYLPEEGQARVSFGIAGSMDKKADVALDADRTKSGTWQKMECEITAVNPPNAFIQLKGTDTFYVDDISLVCLDAPGKNLIENPGFEKFEVYSERKPVGIKPIYGTDRVTKNSPGWKEMQELTMLEMYEEFIPSVRTSVKMSYDEKNLYIYYDCEETDMSGLKETEKEREGQKIWTDDSLEIMLNTKGEGKKYYHFAVTTAGVLYDATVDMANEGAFDDNMYPLVPYDPKWNSNFKADIEKSEKGWTALVTIPLADLGIKRIEKESIWSVNFYRSRPRKKLEHYCWYPTYGGFHSPDKFGTITFLSE